jgi:hypothetical protein
MHHYRHEVLALAIGIIAVLSIILVVAPAPAYKSCWDTFHPDQAGHILLPDVGPRVVCTTPVVVEHFTGESTNITIDLLGREYTLHLHESVAPILIVNPATWITLKNGTLLLRGGACALPGTDIRRLQLLDFALIGSMPWFCPT